MPRFVLNKAAHGWIGVDLDGTLARYDGWKGAGHVGAPVPAMVDRVKRWLAQGRDVRIFTARAAGGGARAAIDKFCRDNFGRTLPVTAEKDKNMVELWDDRAVGVQSNTGKPKCEKGGLDALVDFVKAWGEERPGHKYISRRRGRQGGWEYEYPEHKGGEKKEGEAEPAGDKRDFVKLILDFLSGSGGVRSLTVGQVAHSFRIDKVKAAGLLADLASQGKIKSVHGDGGVMAYRIAPSAPAGEAPAPPAEPERPALTIPADKGSKVPWLGDASTAAQHQKVRDISHKYEWSIDRSAELAATLLHDAGYKTLAFKVAAIMDVNNPAEDPKTQKPWRRSASFQGDLDSVMAVTGKDLKSLGAFIVNQLQDVNAHRDAEKINALLHDAIMHEVKPPGGLLFPDVGPTELRPNMTNLEFEDLRVNRMKTALNLAMKDGKTFEEALAEAQAISTAGPKVWKRIKADYKELVRQQTAPRTPTPPPEAPPKTPPPFTVKDLERAPIGSKITTTVNGKPMFYTKVGKDAWQWGTAINAAKMPSEGMDAYFISSKDVDHKLILPAASTPAPTPPPAAPEKPALVIPAEKAAAKPEQLGLDFSQKLKAERTPEKVAEFVAQVQAPEPPGVAEAAFKTAKQREAEARIAHEVGTHVWGTAVDRRALVTPEGLEALTPAQQAVIAVKSRLLPTWDMDDHLTEGRTPGAILLRHAVESCISAKAGDSLLARQGYMNGIDFVAKSLDACYTEQDIHDFIQEFHYLAMGKRKVGYLSEGELERAKDAAYAAQYGNPPALSADERAAREAVIDKVVAQYQSEMEEFKKWYHDAVRKYGYSMERTKQSDYESVGNYQFPLHKIPYDVFKNRAQVVRDARQSFLDLQEKLTKELGSRFENLSTNEIVAHVFNIPVKEVIYDRGGVLHNGASVYRADPALGSLKRKDLREVYSAAYAEAKETGKPYKQTAAWKKRDQYEMAESNPYSVMAACLGDKMLKLLSSSHPTASNSGSPKAFLDVVVTTSQWEQFGTPEEQRIEETEKILTYKRPGGAKRGAYRWEIRDVPGAVERVGGREITTADSDQLAADFDMPNLQFGQGVAKSDKDSKSHITGAHGALFDLADMLGVDPKHIGLNHRLSLGIASRGHGGARAHYEPTGTIINITRVAGGGSLAHEWGHALDNIVSLTSDPTNTAARDRYVTAGRTRNLSPEAIEAWGGVMDAIRYRDGVTKENVRKTQAPESAFWHNAAAIGGKAECYWTRPHEMFSRAFESYIEDKLRDNGRKSSYLVTGTQKYYKTHTHGKHIPETERNETNFAQPYPQGEERKRINAAMEKLVEVLRKERTLEKAASALAAQDRLAKSEYYTGKNGGKWTAKGSHRPWRETWKTYEDGLRKFRESWPEGKELNRFEAEHKAADKRKLMELKKRADLAKKIAPVRTPEEEARREIRNEAKHPKQVHLPGIMHRGGIADLAAFAKGGKI